jgi:hypothetical protein
MFGVLLHRIPLSELSALSSTELACEAHFYVPMRCVYSDGLYMVSLFLARGSYAYHIGCIECGQESNLSTIVVNS